MRFIEVQAILMAPITPHWSQYIWKLLGKQGFIQKACWPEQKPIDEMILKKDAYLQEALHSFRLRKDTYMKPKKGKAQPQVAVFIPVTYVLGPDQSVNPNCKILPRLDGDNLEGITTHFRKSCKVQPNSSLRLQTPKTPPDSKDIMAQLMAADPNLKQKMKQVMSFVATVKEDWAKKGMSAFALTIGFDEKELLEQHQGLIKQAVGVNEIEITVSEGQQTPGKPYIQFS